MSKNTRRTFLKTVGVAVGAAGIVGAESFQSADASETVAPVDSRATATAPATEWPTFQYDATHRGYAEGADGVNGKIWIEWSELLLEPYSPELSTPAIADGVAYVITDVPNQSVVAYDLDTREVKWTSDALSDPRPFDATPTVANGLVFIASGARVFALDASDGSEVWTYQSYDVPEDDCNVPYIRAASPTVFDGTVYAKIRIGEEGRYYALSADDGSVQWHVTLDGTGKTENSGSTPREIPSVSDGVAYFVDGGTIAAFDAANGTKQWRTDLYAGDGVKGAELRTPTVVGDTVYVTGSYYRDYDSTGHLTALSTDDGSVQWQGGLDGYSGSSLTSPAIADGVAYVGESHVLRAFSTDDGTELWSTGETETSLNVSAPSVADGVVYFPVGTEDDDDSYVVRAFDAKDGTELWDAPLRGIPRAPSHCAVAGDRVYVTDNAGYLYSLSGPTRATNWRRSFASVFGFKSSPAVGEANVYVIDGEDSLRAVNRASGIELWRTSLGKDEDRNYDPVYDPVVHDGTVYCALGEYGFDSWHVQAIDAGSGEELWHYRAEHGVGEPLVHDGTVYIAGNLRYGTPHVYALDAATGREQWSVSVAQNPDDTTSASVKAPVALTDGTVLVATEDGLLTFDADDGSRRWTYDGDTRAVGTADGLVFVGGNFDIGADVVALNPKDGTEQWRKSFDPPASVSELVATGGQVYAIGSGDDGDRLFVMDTDGSEQWLFDTYHNLPYFIDYTHHLTLPAVEDGHVYVGSNDRRVYVLDEETGDVQTRYETFGRVVHSPAVDSGTVYTVSGDSLYSFGNTR